MRRQAQRAKKAAGFDTHTVEAVIPITVIPRLESTHHPFNPKKRTKEDHGKDHGRYSRGPGECSFGKSPRKGRVTRGSSSTDPTFWVTTFK